MTYRQEVEKKQALERKHELWHQECERSTYTERWDT